MGSNRLFNVSTKKATVPRVTAPLITIVPPRPMTSAVVPMPASSMTGRYHDCTNTDCMCAS
jgi:hypothetical protein